MLRSVGKAGVAALPRRAAVAAANCSRSSSRSSGVFCSSTRSASLVQGARAFSQSVREASLNVTFVDVSVSAAVVLSILVLLYCTGFCRVYVA